MGIIGSKYEKKKAELHEKIRVGSIDVNIAAPLEPIGYTCYFCVRHIEGDALVLTEHNAFKGAEAESKYYLHNDCYNSAKTGRKEAQIDLTFCLS